jgi:hypothetical protein
MLIFGHPHIPYEKLYHVSSIDAIVHTPSNATLLFSYDEEVFELIEHASTNGLNFAMQVHSLKEAIICENLNSQYLLVEHDIAKSVQKAAEHYLFDAKVLVHIENEEKIETIANEGIDGVIFSEAIIKVS